MEINNWNDMNRAVARMRDRGLLSRKHLQDFEKFCAGEGWNAEQKKGACEVLRMRNGKKLLIVHSRDIRGSHLTVQGHSAEMAHKFFEHRKVQQAGPCKP